MKELLAIEKLSTEIKTDHGVVHAVCNLDLSVSAGEIIGIAGESGCGKTMSVLSITNLLSPNASITSGKIYFKSEALDIANEQKMQKIRGAAISYIFQDPTASLNPLLTIGEQIGEVYMVHEGISRQPAKEKALAMLKLVGLKPPQEIFWCFPHQLSGGMNQRAMIAMAIASKPQLLIADEPTSSLDRLTEIKIIQLLRQLNQSLDIAIIFITHNISILRGFAHRIAIMYAGRIVEIGDSQAVLDSPKHPYTQALLGCMPEARKGSLLLKTISGAVPDLINPPKACTFHPRCQFIMDQCTKAEPEFRITPTKQLVKCYLW